MSFWEGISLLTICVGIGAYCFYVWLEKESDRVRFFSVPESTSARTIHIVIWWMIGCFEIQIPGLIIGYLLWGQK